MTLRPVLLALCLVATPAHGVDAGQPCSLNTEDVTDNHLGHQTGEIHAGPWAVPGADGVTVTCELEFSNADCYDSPGWFGRVTSEPRAHLGVLPPRLVEYWNPYLRPIFMGTTITWTNADGSPGVRAVDFDGSKPGAQCALITWGNEG